MTDPLGDIGITEGDETPLQEILAPGEGDDYITSYYAILRALEQGTVHTAETQAELPDNGSVDWPLVGIAETTADEFDGVGIHVYNGSEWVDTLLTIEDFIKQIEDELQRYIDEEISELQNEVDELEEELTNPAFIPRITDSPSEIEVGDLIQVEADIVNSGRDSGTQDIRLEVNGTHVDTESNISLQVTESKRVTLEWTASESDVGPVTLTVITDDRSTSRTSQVLQPATFVIDSVSVPDEIENDGPATITPTIRNSGEVAGQKQVSLQINGSTQDSQQPTLSGGQSTPVDLEWDGTTSTGTYTVTIDTPDDTDSSESITVLSPTDFEVDSISVPNSVDADDTETISATIDNVGESEGKKTVYLEIDGSTEDTETVSIGGMTNKNVDLEWDTPSQGGDHTVTVRTDGTELSRSSTVLKAVIGVTSISTSPSENIVAGDSVNVEATVQNTGNTAGSTTVDFSDSDSSIGSKFTGTLSDGDTKSVSVDWDTSDYSGTVTVTAAADGDGQSTSVTITEPEPEFNIDSYRIINDDHYTQTDSNSLQIDIDISNTGDAGGEVAVALLEQEYDLIRDSDTQYISSGDTETVRIDYEWVFGEITLGYKIGITEDQTLSYSSPTASNGGWGESTDIDLVNGWFGKTSSFNINWKAPLYASISNVRFNVDTSDITTWTDVYFDVEIENRSDQSMDGGNYAAWWTLDDGDSGVSISSADGVQPPTIDANSSVNVDGHGRNTGDLSESITHIWIGDNSNHIKSEYHEV